MTPREYSPPEPTCWEYELPGGFKVYAGKTDVDNDLLSLRFALLLQLERIGTGIRHRPVVTGRFVL